MDELQGRSALHGAAWRGSVPQVSQLIAEGATTEARDKNELTPLHLAVEWGQESVVQLLLANGADVNASGYCGATPLHWAAWTSGITNKTAVIDMLIDAGAQINNRQARFSFAPEGATPLGTALFRLHELYAEGLSDSDERIQNYQATIDLLKQRGATK